MIIFYWSGVVIATEALMGMRKKKTFVGIEIVLDHISFFL